MFKKQVKGQKKIVNIPYHYRNFSREGPKGAKNRDKNQRKRKWKKSHPKIDKFDYHYFNLIIKTKKHFKLIKYLTHHLTRAYVD